MSDDEFPLDILPSGHTGEFERYILQGFNMSKDNLKIIDDKYVDANANFVVEVSPCVYDLNLPATRGVAVNPTGLCMSNHQALDSSDLVFSSYPDGITLEHNQVGCFCYLADLVGKVVRWHRDRNLIKGSTDKDQYCKLMQEAGELSDSICKGKDVSDDIGDMMVVLINIAERNGLSLSQCLERAWDDIKHRKGRMVNGVFIKESDL